MNTKKLSKNHRRVISSRVQMIKNKITEIEQMLTQSKQWRADQISERLSPEEAEKLIHHLRKIKTMLVDFSERYDLQFYAKSERAMVLTRLSNMLDISEDLYTQKLKGYGTFNPGMEKAYDKDITTLEKATKQALAVFNES